MDEVSPVNEFRPVREWFTFEFRCLVCGLKCGAGTWGYTFQEHLRTHCDEGVLEKNGDGAYRQVKAHPAGFPGILLPKEMQWTT